MKTITKTLDCYEYSREKWNELVYINLVQRFGKNELEANAIIDSHQAEFDHQYKNHQRPWNAVYFILNDSLPFETKTQAA